MERGTWVEAEFNPYLCQSAADSSFWGVGGNPRLISSLFIADGDHREHPDRVVSMSMSVHTFECVWKSAWNCCCEWDCFNVRVCAHMGMCTHMHWCSRKAVSPKRVKGTCVETVPSRLASTGYLMEPWLALSLSPPQPAKLVAGPQSLEPRKGLPLTVHGFFSPQFSSHEN